MKNSLFAFVLTLSFCGTVRAVENGNQVAYSRSIPSSIRSQTPRESVTRFFGKRRIESLHADVFLHLYQPKQRSAGAKRESVSQSPYWLDIFTREKKRLTKVQHIRVPNSEGDWSFSARLMWLDTKQQKMPVVMLEISNSGNFYGPTASFPLFVFPQGLRHKVTMQIFSAYGDHNETTNFYFDQLDERGFMVVKQVYDVGGDKPSQETILRWDGKRFSAEQAQTK